MSRDLPVSSIVAPIFILRGKTLLDKKSFNEYANLQLHSSIYLIRLSVVSTIVASVAVKFVLFGYY